MLTLAQDLKKGSFIEYGGHVSRIVEHTYQVGGGKAGGTVHLRIKDVSTGHVHEVKFDPHHKVEALQIERRRMKYLYEDGQGLCFMDPSSYEQVILSKESIGNLVPYLKEEAEVDVEFYGGNPIHVDLPEKIALKVITTGAPKKGETDSVYKPATLEGGAEVLVPQFIKTGDRVFVNVETGKYIDRVKE